MVSDLSVSHRQLHKFAADRGASIHQRWYGTNWIGWPLPVAAYRYRRMDRTGDGINRVMTRSCNQGIKFPDCKNPSNAFSVL